jgi:hypothetical protein
MPSADVLKFSEDFDSMTFPECLAFIERSRRQLTRLDRMPQLEGSAKTDGIASILRDLDDFEQRIRSHPDCSKTPI